jgi:hypothetical protein
MMETVKKLIKTSGSGQNLFEVLYALCKIRGYKTILKFFPHDAADLEPCFYFLSTLNSPTQWQAQYILLIWLSLIVLVPFDLDTIDSNGNLIQNIVNHCKVFLEHTGKPREGAGITIAKLLTRPDIVNRGLLDDFLQWSLTIFTSDQEFLKLGCLFTVVQIFIFGTRSELLKHLKQTVKFLETTPSNNTFIRQFRVKLAGRLSLTQLRPIVAGWRYSRGSRSLIANLSSNSLTGKIYTNAASIAVKSKTSESQEDQTSMDEDLDYEVLESAIDNLLTGLRDRDNVVRWAAAKAIGRLTNRLDHSMGDEVVAQVLSLFKPNELDSAWHGGCLALAELARRGLLVPSRLPEVFPLLYQALLYDKKQGNHSIGAHVRDAACYLAWSFARAYDPSEMQNHLHQLARHLIIVALFDREVNCRRAASAAFQEHVGRQGSFPHGIEILTEADYFTLGNRNHAYLHVTCFIAQFPEYLQFMVDHLVEQKLKHWDIVIRQLAACSLSVLAPFAPEYFIHGVLQKLVAQVFDNNLVHRHGAILGAGESVLGLAGGSGENNDPKTIEKMIYKHSGNYYLLKSNVEVEEKDKAILADSENQKYFKVFYRKLQNTSNLHVVPNALLGKIKEVVPTIEKKRLYRGKGGQIIRIAVCRYLECLSKSRIGLTQAQILKAQETLNECICHNAPEVQEAGSSSFSEFSEVYHNSSGSALVKLALETHIISLESFNGLKEIPASTTRGAALAIGCCNFHLLSTDPGKIINLLIQSSKIKGNEQDDPETRRNSITALGNALIKLLRGGKTTNPEDVIFDDLVSLQGFSRDLVQVALDAVYSASFDYSNDKRGDVGSWVRQACMQVFFDVSQTDFELSSENWERIFAVLLRQLVEKIDRLRQVAGDIIEKLLTTKQLPAWTEELRPVFIENKEFLQMFKEKMEKNQKAESLPDQSEMPTQTTMTSYERSNLWSVPSFVFPLVTPLLKVKMFRKDLLQGLVISVGGITESTVRSSSAEFVNVVRSNLDIAQDILEVFKTCEERLELPFLKAWSFLFKGIENFKSSPLAAGVLTRSQEIIRGSKDIMKWLAFIDTVSGLLDHQEVHREALRIVLAALGQPYPKVRTLAAQNLFNFFNSILNYQQVCNSEEDLDSIIDLLSGTPWVQGLNEVRPVRNQIFQMLGMEPPKLKNPNPAAQVLKEKEDDSYKNLVNEVGF